MAGSPTKFQVVVGTQFFENRNIGSLCEILQISLNEAAGAVASFWLWAQKEHPDGDLNGVSSRSIADACRWFKKDHDAFSDALINANFISPEMQIEDWPECCGEHIMSRGHATERQRKSRMSRLRHSDVTVTSSKKAPMSQHVTVTSDDVTVTSQGHESNGFVPAGYDVTVTKNDVTVTKNDVTVTPIPKKGEGEGGTIGGMREGDDAAVNLIFSERENKKGSSDGINTTNAGAHVREGQPTNRFRKNKNAAAEALRAREGNGLAKNPEIARLQGLISNIPADTRAFDGPCQYESVLGETSMGKIAGIIEKYDYSVDPESFLADILRRCHAVVGDLEQDRVNKVMRSWLKAINPEARKDQIAHIRNWSEKFLIEEFRVQKDAASAAEVRAQKT